MISNPFFLLSVLLSSFFAFFTAAFIIETFIKLFKLKQYRIKSMLRLLPFFSLIIDLLFKEYSIAYWINPLSCASCIQKLFLEFFFPHLKVQLAQSQVSLIHHLGSHLEHSLFSAIFILFGAFSLFFVLKKIFQSIFLMKSLHSVAKRALPIAPTQTSLMLKKSKVKIYLSSEIQVPLTVYPNTIIIPQKTTEDLSKQELDAVILHEWEHIKYQDPLARLLYHLIATFFWWLPLRTWMKKIEQEQELACDQNVLKYGIDGDSIASALFKVARQTKVHPTLCCFTHAENFTLTRIQDILGVRTKNPKSLLSLGFFAVLSAGVFLLMCTIYL